MPQQTLSPEVVEQLRQFDSPTIANAIEKFKVRPDTVGYTGPDVRCLFPRMGVMVGYAVTGVMDNREVDDKSFRDGWLSYCQALEDSPRPSIAVIQDGVNWPNQAALVGEVMATVMQRLGALGLITNGAVRDVDQVEALNFQYHASGVIVSHGHLKFTDVQNPVRIGRLEVRPGDLLHADVNGIVVVPQEIAAEIPAAAQAILDREAEIMEVARAEGFRAADLRRFY